MNVLVLGASGMLGNAVFRFLGSSEGFTVVGTTRSVDALRFFPVELRTSILTGYDVNDVDHLVDLFRVAEPHVVINCVGLVKQLDSSNNPLHAIPINALLPHRLVSLCSLSKSRLIHLSTDCVFSGNRGQYKESDLPDSKDIYGRSKLLGEVSSANSVTLRTSIIGHELNGARSLINWFLSQDGSVRGYKRAIFSGLPTVEIARVIRDFVIPNTSLSGVYHVASSAISKFDLLQLVAGVYSKNVDIVPDENVIIDRSLDSSRFKSATGYVAPTWPELVRKMYDFQ